MAPSQATANRPRTTSNGAPAPRTARAHRSRTRASATGTVPAAANLSGLDVYREDSPPYHFRLVATNGAGTTYGPDMTFHTLPPNLPEISEESASNVTPSSATLSAEINPGLGDTIYCSNTGRARHTARQPSRAHRSVATKSRMRSVTKSPSLTPGVTYHFRVVATNFGGTSYGSDQTFEHTGPAGDRGNLRLGRDADRCDAGSDGPAGVQPDDLPLRVRGQHRLRCDNAARARRSAPTTSSTP